MAGWVIFATHTETQGVQKIVFGREFAIKGYIITYTKLDLR